jgi:hypothetical protein
MYLGTALPDLTLLRPEGTSAALSSFFDRDHLLVIFLRHLV